MELDPCVSLCAASASCKRVGEQRRTGCFLQDPVQGEGHTERGHQFPLPGIAALLERAGSCVVSVLEALMWRQDSDTACPG